MLQLSSCSGPGLEKWSEEVIGLHKGGKVPLDIAGISCFQRDQLGAIVCIMKGNYPW